MFLFAFAFIEIAMAQSPEPSLAPAIVAQGSGGILAFLKANLPAICGLLYFILDIVIKYHPSLPGRGLLDQLEIWLGKESGQVPPPPPSAAA